MVSIPTLFSLCCVRCGTRFSGEAAAYIVGQQLNHQPITLYYAFPSDEMAKSAQLYFYSGVIKRVEQVNQGQSQQKVTFSNALLSLVLPRPS